ncbi:hypothetical protein AL052_20090 [Pseudomonas amygdali pv. eriobotryae]|nr:hypothetical protein AL052_20090 [Pseudomonas amygdali pv. eriobotryae]
MTEACKGFQTQEILHDSLDDIINKQFSAEGIKRVESFLFESFLRTRLQNCDSVKGLKLSFGWMIGFNKYGEISYWFRFQENENDWNEVDQTLVNTITDESFKACTPIPSIHRISYLSSSNSYHAQTFKDKNWSYSSPLQKTLSGLLLKRRSGSIRNTEEDHFNNDRFKKASTWMKKDFFGKHIKNISIQRRLVNCFLVPALGSQIVDLDAVILTPDGKVSCLEFKRKYPAIRMKVFGLDSHPHIKLIKHLDNYSIGIRHIILVPPDWDKNTSPLDMLKDTMGRELWHWLAVDLNLSCIGTIKMNTYGTDSGQSGEKRTQYNIEWCAVYLINEGIKLNKDGEMRLLNFLASGETKNLSNIDYKYLYDKRRQTPSKFKVQT